MTGKLPHPAELRWSEFVQRIPHCVLSTTLKAANWSEMHCIVYPLLVGQAKSPFDSLTRRRELKLLGQRQVGEGAASRTRSERKRVVVGMQGAVSKVPQCRRMADTHSNKTLDAALCRA
jgi:hypothetical protein